MRIDPASAAAAAAAPPSQASEPSGASRDEFLRLLVAQLENQNPLNPQSGAEFVAQLAQFASVEQTAETNQRLAAIQAGQAAASNAALAGFVGKSATVAADAITVAPGGAMPPLSVELGGPASSVEVVIRDSAGRTVRTLQRGAAAAGTVPVAWDGTDANGVPLEPGTYTVEVTAEAADGTAVAARPTLSGRIDAIEFTGGFPRLRIGAASVAPADVSSIH